MVDATAEMPPARQERALHARRQAARSSRPVAQRGVADECRPVRGTSSHALSSEILRVVRNVRLCNLGAALCSTS